MNLLLVVLCVLCVVCATGGAEARGSSRKLATREADVPRPKTDDEVLALCRKVSYAVASCIMHRSLSDSDGQVLRRTPRDWDCSSVTTSAKRVLAELPENAGGTARPIPAEHLAAPVAECSKELKLLVARATTHTQALTPAVLLEEETGAVDLDALLDSLPPLGAVDTDFSERDLVDDANLVPLSKLMGGRA